MQLRDLSHLSVTVTRHYGISAVPGGKIVLGVEAKRSRDVCLHYKELCPSKSGVPLEKVVQAEPGTFFSMVHNQ